MGRLALDPVVHGDRHGASRIDVADTTLACDVRIKAPLYARPARRARSVAPPGLPGIGVELRGQP